MKAETPWSAGRLDSLKGPRRLLFGQMYEDSEVEREAFRGKGRIFCIASAGNTAMQLSQEHDVVACDINPVQLAYAERRANGAPMEIGDAERAMYFARAFMPLIGWKRELVQVFLALSDGEEQLTFWREHLDTRRFRASLSVLMSRPVLRAMYARQFLSFLPARFGTVIRKRLEIGFAQHTNASNPYLRALLLGEASREPQARAANIQFILGDAASVLESCAVASFGGFALSNILDGASPAYRERVVRAVRRAAREDAVIVLRSFAEPSKEPDANYSERDRSILWGIVNIRSARTF